MKNFNKKLVAVLFTAMVFLSSCIENTVAPEVAALRQAQVDLLTAKTDLQTLQNQAQQILNDYQAAMNALALTEATAQLDANLAEIQVALAEAETKLAEAEAELLQAIADLAAAANDIAAAHLADYGDSMEDYYDALYDIAGQEAYLAELNLMLGADDPNGGGDDISFTLAAQILQRDLDADLAEMVGLELILTALQAVQADPTTVDAAIAAAYANVETLENANAQLDVDIAQDEYDNVIPAYNAYYMVVGGWSWNSQINYEGIIPTYENAVTAWDNIQENIDDEIEENAVLQAEIDARLPFEATLLADFATAEALFLTNDAAYEAAKVARADAGRDRDAKWVDVENAVESVYPSDAITDTWLDMNKILADADPVLTDAIAARDAAETALVTEQAAYDAGYANAQTAAGTAADAYWTDTDLSGFPDAAPTDAGALPDYLKALNDYDGAPTSANLTALNAARTAMVSAELAAENADFAVEEFDANLNDANVNVYGGNYWVYGCGPCGDFYTGTRNELTTAENDYNTAESNLDNHIAANPEVDFAAIVTASQAAWDLWYASLPVFADALEAEGIAQTARNSAESIMNNIDAMLNDFNGVSSRILRKMDRIAENEEDIAEYLLDQADEQEIIDALEADYLMYDDAAIVALYEVYEDAQDANDDMGILYDQNDELIEAEWTLIDILEDHIDNVNEEMEDLLDDIEDLQVDIEQAQLALDDNMISEEEYLAEVAAEEAYLVQLQEEAAGYLALADSYLALYLAAIGG